MIGSLFDTISSSIDNFGDLLGWLFIGAAILFFLRGNNGKSDKSNRSSSSSSSSTPSNPS